MLGTDLLLSIGAFALVVSITPGPNNFIAMSSGASFGLLATIPFMTGVAVGVPVMLIAVAAGLGSILAAFPAVAVLLKAGGLLYLLWLAWKIAISTDLGFARSERRTGPPSFIQSCLLQWVNPKAWIVAVGGLGTYATPATLWRVVAALIVIFAVVAWSSTALWAACGVAVRRLLGSPLRIRLFNLAMAILLLASLWPVVREMLPQG
jgi:threonine/homoserine/homoserine lactone efflux protein